jgi:hypothetical protein
MRRDRGDRSARRDVLPPACPARPIFGAARLFPFGRRAQAAHVERFRRRWRGAPLDRRHEGIRHMPASQRAPQRVGPSALRRLASGYFGPNLCVQEVAEVPLWTACRGSAS